MQRYPRSTGFPTQSRPDSRAAPSDFASKGSLLLPRPPTGKLRDCTLRAWTWPSEWAFGDALCR
jgi:hypothetical protein